MREFNNESLHSPGVKLPLDENLANVHSRCSLSSTFIIHEGLKFLVKLMYINYIFKLVKYLHWQGINKSTSESFHTSFPTPSKTSQLECLFTILNDKLPVQSFRSRF